MQEQVDLIDKNYNDKLSGEKDEKQKKNINEAYTKFKSGVEELQKSSIIYDLGERLEKMPKNIAGLTYYDVKEKNVKMDFIMIGKPGSGIETIRHEFEHMFQFERKQLSFDKTGKKGGYLYDLMDEAEAYRTQEPFVWNNWGYGIPDPKTNMPKLPDGYEGINKVYDFDENGHIFYFNRTFLNITNEKKEEMKKNEEIFNESFEDTKKKE